MPPARAPPAPPACVTVGLVSDLHVEQWGGAPFDWAAAESADVLVRAPDGAGTVVPRPARALRRLGAVGARKKDDPDGRAHAQVVAGDLADTLADAQAQLAEAAKARQRRSAAAQREHVPDGRCPRAPRARRDFR